MPELPEVETIVRSLEKNLLNKKVTSIDLRYTPLLEKDSPYGVEVLQGRTFTSFDRRGKYLVLGFDNQYYWIIHLRMEGKFNLYSQNIKPTIHTHLTLYAEPTWVHYLDTRKFSRMVVVTDVESYFLRKGLGLEPFDPKLTGEVLFQHFKRRNRAIKISLLDQSIVAGVGNIYADEILYAVKINPLQQSSTLSRLDCDKIVTEMRRILKHAIAAGGTTIRSYTSSLDVTGRFQISLDAYGRSGQPCKRCNTTMKRIVVGGRGTVFCPKCQKEKA